MISLPLTARILLYLGAGLAELHTHLARSARFAWSAVTLAKTRASV